MTDADKIFIALCGVMLSIGVLSATIGLGLEKIAKALKEPRP